MRRRRAAVPKPSEPRWAVLIHAVPARPLYLRARVRRRLAAAGAAPVKKAVYVLPDSPAALERLRAIASEIEAAGGSAFVCESTFPDPSTERRVARLYDEERRRLAQRSAASPARRGPSSLVGLRWVTRRGLHVDRLACAWIVRRFVDPAATFRFIAAPGAAGAALGPREIGFDMTGAAVTHEDGRCSVEALVRIAGIDDAAVQHVAELVHDVDLGDDRYGHAETTVFRQLLEGMIANEPDDAGRLERGLALFDALHASLAGRASRTRPSRSGPGTPRPRSSRPPSARPPSSRPRSSRPGGSRS